MIITYLLTSDLKDERAGLVAAGLISLIPGLIPTTVAGRFENGLLITSQQYLTLKDVMGSFFAILTFYLFMKSMVANNSILAVFTALSFFLLSTIWSGYIFVLNCLAIYIVAVTLLNYVDRRVYKSYTIFFVAAMLLLSQVL